MDALELLKTDHQKIDSLFKQIENTDDRAIQWSIFTQLHAELARHARVLEMVFHPFLERFDELREPVRRGRAHQGRLRRELDALLAEGAPTPDFLARLRLLHGEAERHFEDEENGIFPVVRQRVHRPERERLGRHLATARSATSRAA